MDVVEIVASKFPWKGTLIIWCSVALTVLLGMVIYEDFLRQLASLICAYIPCLSSHVPRLGTIENSMGVEMLHPSLPPFFPLGHPEG